MELVRTRAIAELGEEAAQKLLLPQGDVRISLFLLKHVAMADY
jgi:hypothetical protein